MSQTRLVTLLLTGAITVLSVHVLHRVLEGFRADLTAGDLYSLSEGSVRILDRMREEGVKPIEIKLYFSESSGQTLPRFIKDFITYNRYLRYLLGEYERASNGRVQVDFIDPITDSDDAENATKDGLESRPINQHGDLFFFGLTLETQTGSKDSIPFLWPNEQEGIEYEISKRIHSLLWPSSKRIGVISSLEVFGTADNPYMAQMLAAQGRAPSEKWIALQLLEERYELSQISTDQDEISSEDYDVVVVIHPKRLSGKLLWALDEWIVRGGRTLVFVDPYTLSDQAPQNPQQPWAAMQYEPSSSLATLLSAWGLESPEQTFAADLELAVRRPVIRGGPSESVVVDLQYTEENSGLELADHPILKGLSSVRLFMAGTLEKSDTAEAEFLPLITTTATGNTLQIQAGFGGQDGLYYTDLNDAAKLRDHLQPGTEPVVIAYQISGKLPSAYPEGTEFPSTAPVQPPGLPPGIELPPPEGTEMISKDAVPESERAESTVLVFADVDLISDQLAFQRNILGLTLAANDNHKILLNAIDHLLGADELMSLRSKQNLTRPFLLFDDIEAEAEKETLERERDIRAQIESFQTELRSKQNEITQRNAALFQRNLQEEVDRLNERIQEKNSELRDIRLARREDLAREENWTRLAVLGWMPSLILLVGLGVYVRRRRQEAETKKGAGA